MRFLALLRAALLGGALFLPTSGYAAGREAPAFTLKDIHGKKFELASHLKKEVVVLDFFATWCTPCLAELPALQGFADKYGKDGLQVIVISIDDPKDAAKVRELVQENGWKFPVLLDGDTTVVSLYDSAKTVPFSAVIDRAGTVASEHIGYKPGDEAKLEAELKDLLARK